MLPVEYSDAGGARRRGLSLIWGRCPGRRVCSGGDFLGLGAQSLHLKKYGPDFGKFRIFLGSPHMTPSPDRRR